MHQKLYTKVMLGATAAGLAVALAEAAPGSLIQVGSARQSSSALLDSAVHNARTTSSTSASMAELEPQVWQPLCSCVGRFWHEHFCLPT